ncbi:MULTISPECIES: hypothetical protein [unclassified Peribacillus]|uniref:hypothetical protein n=1 Tax=unclassified Peribacillus TaxID=2675266 RepID=UPI001A911AB6|nr:MULTISPECIES: hypothetical protein [unclassified Peribacillus]WMX58830.1 hypothetical protein RE409_29910 [Peribacillus sp. R9-11]
MRKLKNLVKSKVTHVPHYFQNGKPCFSFPHQLGKVYGSRCFDTAHAVTDDY